MYTLMYTYLVVVVYIMEMQREQSEFNMAVSFLNRINLLFYQANGAALDLDAFGWYHALSCLFRELSGYMNKDEMTGWWKEKDGMNSAVTKNLNKVKKTGMKQIEPELYKALEEFEVFLRYVLKSSGLQTKMVDDPSRAMSTGFE